MQFSKYHALGNDYVVLPAADFDRPFRPDEIRKICRPHTGLGADGVLWATLRPEIRRFAVRIFNPDGTEAGISGNGVRIFARFLWDGGYINDEPVEIDTPSGASTAFVQPRGAEVAMTLGPARFASSEIPVAGPPREVIEEPISGGGRTFRFSAVTVGNPHCVIVVPAVSADEARAAGPEIARDPRFPEGTNVQFVQILDRTRIRMEIWERGAGYTLSSGSSSAAAAAVTRRLGLVESRVSVEMPGGVLSAAVENDGRVTISGPVVKICQGTLSAELFLQNE